MTIFIGLIVAYVSVLVISFWANRLEVGLSGKGMLITGIIAFIAACLLQLFAPEALITTAIYIGLGIVVITLIVNMIPTD